MRVGVTTGVGVGDLYRRLTAGTVTPTALFDPALRLYTDTGGTTPSTADGDVIRNYTASDGTVLLQASTVFATRQTVGGKTSVRIATSTLSSGLTTATAVLPSVRPDKLDVLIFYTANGLSTALVPVSTSPQTPTLMNSGGNTFQPGFSRSASDGTGVLRLTTALRLYSVGLGTDATLSTAGSGYRDGSLSDGWTAVRTTLTGATVRLRTYTGPGALVSDLTVNGANGDEVLSTSATPGSAMTVSLYRGGFGRVYRNWGGVYSDAEITALFADAAYP